MPRYRTYSRPLPRMRSLLLPLIALAATGVSAHEGHDHDHAQVVEEPPKPVESLAHSFTVSRQLISQFPSVDLSFLSRSLPKSRLHSWNSSPTTGPSGGHRQRPPRKLQWAEKSSPTWENGLSKSLLCSPSSMVTRVSSPSRKPPTMLFLLLSPNPSTFLRSRSSYSTK